MVETIVFEWKMILLPIAAFLYIELLKHLDIRFAARRTVTDEEYLAHIARSRSTSEYDLFHVAAGTWHIAARQVEDDFKRYVTEGQMPHYVRDYVRRMREEIGELDEPAGLGG